MRVGHTPVLREDTSDANEWKSVYDNDEYRIPVLRADDVIIDIGASIGAFARKAHDRGSRIVDAFEACPDKFEIGKQNTADLTGVTFYNRAVVGDRQPDEIGFPAGCDSLFIPEKPLVMVKTITLHSIMEKAGRVRFLKIDIEGAEWEVLYSLPDSFYGNIMEIAGEYHQPSRTYWSLKQDQRRPNYDYLTLQQFLQDRGFHTTFKPPTPPPMSGAFHAVRL